ncbi:hypothetical protein R5R35_001578 [Gryllus longicercus]|uniref:Uncharacterized protein n=1 Tax=Gryllus longicercus TaxID=2509291 RepID=A0AAN9VZM1_9ORTH
MDPKNYNRLDPSIHKISNSMSLNEDRRKLVNAQLSELLESRLLPAMKEVDEDFRNLFQRLHYSGSYYENLRISEPNEFDLNLELRSQKGSQKFFQVHYTNEYPGFVQIKHIFGDTVKKWVNGSGFVMQHKVLCWLQGVVDKALRKISDGPWHKLWPGRSGPAVTLYAEYVPGEVFSVDLVPVFVLDPSQWPRSPVRQPVITNNTFAEQWCVVPKPNNHIDGNGNIGTFWRMSFYNQEKVILKNKNHLKNALKLMKLLRDKEGWHSLSSYYLKTVYLWTLTETDSHFWNAGIGVVFMNMLRTLRDYLKEKQSIPFFWDSGLNVLSSIDLVEILNIGYRLDRIIKNIDRNLNDGNPQYIEKLFPVSDRSQNPSTDESPTESLQQANSHGWKIAVGVGALAIVGAVLFKSLGNNRD